MAEAQPRPQVKRQKKQTAEAPVVESPSVSPVVPQEPPQEQSSKNPEGFRRVKLPSGLVLEYR